MLVTSLSEITGSDRLEPRDGDRRARTRRLSFLCGLALALEYARRDTVGHAATRCARLGERRGEGGFQRGIAAQLSKVENEAGVREQL